MLPHFKLKCWEILMKEAELSSTRSDFRQITELCNSGFKSLITSSKEELGKTKD